MAVLYNDLFEKRQEGDYVDFVYFSESEITPLIRKTEDFVNHIENILGKKQQTPNA